MNKRESVASTSVLNFARQVGIRFEVTRGLVWEKPHLAGRILEHWAKKIWEAYTALEYSGNYPDELAAQNARMSVKRFYLDTIGALCKEYSQEYYHRDWNSLIIQEAIARQGYSIMSRLAKGVDGNIVLVCNDQIYLVTDDSSIESDMIASWVEFRHMLKGYKYVGYAPMDDEIIQSFDRDSPMKIEALIKGKMVKV
jgi:hypothetical protein